MNVCQKNVARFVHMERKFDKIKDFFRFLEAWCYCDFRKIDALQVSKQIWKINMQQSAVSW